MKVKFFSKLISIICVLGIVANCLVASAAPTNIKIGDVNCDNIVNSEDLAALSDFLNGKLNINIDRGDINGDGIVTSDDATLLGKYLTGQLTRPADRSVGYMTATSKDSRTYISHNFDNNSDNIYSLTLNTALGGAVDSGVNPNPYTPPASGDDREAASNNAVVKLNFKWSNGVSGLGTGFIIGSNLVATVKHCVYDVTNDKWCVSSSITINNTTYNVLEAHVPEGIVDKVGCEYDYALLKIDTNVDLAATYGSFKFAPYTDTLMNSPDKELNNIMLAGYSKKDDIRYLHIALGKLRNTSVNNEKTDLIVYADIYHTAGDSGGPYIVDMNGDHKLTASDKYVVGIHSGGSVNAALGARITAHHMKFYYDNKYI